MLLKKLSVIEIFLGKNVRWKHQQKMHQNEGRNISDYKLKGWARTQFLQGWQAFMELGTTEQQYFTVKINQWEYFHKPLPCKKGKEAA